MDRALNITQTPDGRIIIQNEWDGGLRTWMVSSASRLSWLIYEATAEDTLLRIYRLPLNSIVLERFHVIARPYEVEADGEVDE